MKPRPSSLHHAIPTKGQGNTITWSSAHSRGRGRGAKIPLSLPATARLRPPPSKCHHCSATRHPPPLFRRHRCSAAPPLPCDVAATQFHLGARVLFMEGRPVPPLVHVGRRRILAIADAARASPNYPSGSHEREGRGRGVTSLGFCHAARGEKRG
jgi:hypothetical protein